MTLPAGTAARDERGFILVGVVMFMLALTILGLSLFALSSYEAQFFYASQSREQSLQSSESGMEVVKALLSSKGTLDAAQSAVGEFGITRALAYQWRSSNANDTTSKGFINWDSTLVVVVTARTGGEQRTVESRFIPVEIKSPYHQLISCGGAIRYNPLNGTNRTLELTGKVWQHVQSSGDTAWTANVSWPSGRPIDPTTPSTPVANDFVDKHLTTSNKDDGTNWDHDQGKSYIKFSNTSPTPKFYHSPASPSDGNGDPEFASYEFYIPYDLKLRVRGTVIWLVNQGACFHGPVTVALDNTGSPATLIVVAKRNGRDSADPNRGLWFQGGIAVSDTNMIKVYLVTEGDITIDQTYSSGTSLDGRALSVVTAGNVEIMGPRSGDLSRLGHAVAMDEASDDLLIGGWLPATTSSTGGKFFQYAWHSWHESQLP